MGFRVGIDIGGTFTDVAILDEATGEIGIVKSPTTYRDPVQGILDCLMKAKIDSRRVLYTVHGTTIVTNAIIERTLGKTALITTKGFRDVLEIMRLNRPFWGLFAIQWDKPQPLVPRHLRFELDERVDAKGDIVKPLVPLEARNLAAKLKQMQVESVAVCLLFSHLNPKHENEIRKIFAEEAPDIHVSISSEVNPQAREYERSSTTTINALTKPLAKRYFSRVENGLRQAGINSRLFIMKSSGGLIGVQQAWEFPVYTIESGPVSGTIGSAYVGELIGQNNLIAIDMGGTTFKVSIVDDGTPKTRSEGEVEWGVPYRTAMIDLSEIGAGGGSIASIDIDGVLRVGPRSAGAEPGPVCFGRGGVEPTFTDACLVLAYLNPGYLLGGEMKIDRKAAEEAIRSKIARPLGLDTVEAAYGIVEVLNQLMLGSMRVSSMEKGYDPRDFATMAYGGAGPMVAAYLAHELGSPLVIIPPYPGIFSALGMLVADVRLDFMRSFHFDLSRVDLDKMNQVYTSLQKEAIDTLQRDFTLRHKVLRTADMRYTGQNYDANAQVPAGPITERTLAIAKNNFAREHERLYGHSKIGDVQFSNLRVTIIGLIKRPSLRTVPKTKSLKCKGRREVYFGNRHSFVDSPIYDRSTLGCGVELRGPCVIEEIDSTVIIYPRQKATVDKYGDILIETK